MQFYWRLEMDRRCQRCSYHTMTAALRLYSITANTVNAARMPNDKEPAQSCTGSVIVSLIVSG